MQYKAVAVDLDGTLLTNNKEITKKTIQTIQSMGDHALFTIATGRPIAGIRSILNQLDLDVAVITYNGAKIIKSKSLEVLYEKSLRTEDARLILELGLERKTSLIVWAEENLYVNELNDRALKYSKISDVSIHVFTDIEEVLQKQVTKIIWYDEVDRVEFFMEELATLLPSSINFHPSNPEFLEFVDGEVSKANALKHLEEIYGFTREELIAIGDGYNDLSMLEYAGLGVAMENAPDGVKKRAKYITKSNEEDGVAFVIEHFIMKNATKNK